MEATLNDDVSALQLVVSEPSLQFVSDMSLCFRTVRNYLSVLSELELTMFGETESCVVWCVCHLVDVYGLPCMYRAPLIMLSKSLYTNGFSTT